MKILAAELNAAKRFASRGDYGQAAWFLKCADCLSQVLDDLLDSLDPELP